MIWCVLCCAGRGLFPGRCTRRCFGIEIEISMGNGDKGKHSRKSRKMQQQSLKIFHLDVLDCMKLKIFINFHLIRGSQMDATERGRWCQGRTWGAEMQVGKTASIITQSWENYDGKYLKLLKKEIKINIFYLRRKKGAETTEKHRKMRKMENEVTENWRNMEIKG